MANEDGSDHGQSSAVKTENSEQSNSASSNPVKMSVGKVGEFNASSGNWTLYVERLEMYFKVNDVKPTLWVPTLIAVMGDEAYELLSNLVSPKKPADLGYAEVVEVLRNHLQPKPSELAERYRFRQRRQLSEESVSQYVTELKKLAKNCNFGAGLEENLRDQFVCGLKSDVIRQRLFAEEQLKYTTAVKLSCSLEAAERDAAAVEQADHAGGGQAAADSPVLAMTSAGARIENHRDRAGPHSGGGQRPSNWRTNGNGSQSYSLCNVCGADNHRREDCRYKKYICGKCKQRGHLRRQCPNQSQRYRNGNKNVHHVDTGPGSSMSTPMDNGSEDSSSELEEELHQLSLNSYKPVSMSLNVENVKLKMEVDTGSAVSCVSKATYDEYFSALPIEPFELVLRFYDGSRVEPLGIIKPLVQYGESVKNLELFVIEGGTTSLLGRQWLSELGIQIPMLHNTCTGNSDKRNNAPANKNNEVLLLLNRYKELFSGGLGRYSRGTAKLYVREGAVPVFCRPRPLPYSLRGRVDEELDSMLRAGIIEPVETSEWATPLVPVRRADGGLRICADYKVTLNPVLLIDKYPLPKVEDLFVGLSGAKYFSKIDLSQAYNQVVLDDPDNLTVINTHKGLFKYKRLVYGLSSSPGIFQRIMSTLLSDIPNVQVFLDDIILASKDKKSHLILIEKVLQRLQEAGLKLKEQKCFFMMDEVKYLGFIISKNGIQVDPEKVEAVVKIPQPTNVSQLRSFLGLVNFYARFVPNISAVLAPLYELLKKGKRWNWGPECESSFQRIKVILTGTDVLAHYDTNKPLILTCDASPLGISGVLSLIDEVGVERPVSYASRSLSQAEKNYSQIDREALAIVFSLRKFHQYIYGRHFTLRTDHKPLVSIFGPKQGIPLMAASRLQRWSVLLSAYNYDIEYINTNNNGADSLSRLPIPAKTADLFKFPEQSYLHHVADDMLLDYQELKRQTANDQLLGRVLNYIRNGWPAENEIKALQPYFNRKTELYEELGCVMWGHRVVIPLSCTKKVLTDLHECHMGIVKTKAMARSYVWWPGVDEAVEAMCRGCAVCAAEADAPPRRAPALWPWPAQQWSRIHADFLGPIEGKLYLVVVDARTKWLEVFNVSSTSANNVINKFSELFARWGIPRQLVTDNGPPFTSREVTTFLNKQGIQHLYSAPYHPASNGAAENAVRTIKKVIKKAIRQKNNLELAIQTFLLYYRNTPHCTTGESPASLMLGRPMRTKFDLLRPDCGARVQAAQQRQLGERAGAARQLRDGAPVWLRQYRGDHRWAPGTVAERIGTTDYRVQDALGRECHRHIDQLRQRHRSSLVVPSVEPDSRPTVIPEHTNSNDEGPEVWASPPTSPRVRGSPSAGSSPRASVSGGPIARSSTSEAAVVTDIEPTTSQSEPPQPTTVPTRTRPMRQCRINNPPNYRI